MAEKMLRVTIRDDLPSLKHGDPAKYRTVTLELTEEQQADLDLKVTGEIKGMAIRETISHVFFD